MAGPEGMGSIQSSVQKEVSGSPRVGATSSRSLLSVLPQSIPWDFFPTTKPTPGNPRLRLREHCWPVSKAPENSIAH